jgi:hypothetical protein
LNLHYRHIYVSAPNVIHIGTWNQSIFFGGRITFQKYAVGPPTIISDLALVESGKLYS